jgi:alanyl-tRNA synthetase
MTVQLYLKDALCLEFQAEVMEIYSGVGGQVSAVLSETYFYPTSGGQDHDTGRIGEANVLDVFKEPGNRIIHILDREILPGLYPARIDKPKRWQNMQAHTAQHILSRAFEYAFDLETLSANINSVNPSTIDLDVDSILEIELNQVEEIANSIIYENRLVKSYFIVDKDIPQIPFRRPPKVSGTIRVVEIDGFDYSACGGTHCPQTGMVGLIKIIKTETQNHKLRIHFVSGAQALKQYQFVLRTASTISDVMDTSLSELTHSVQRQIEKIKQLQMDLDTVKSKYLALEAKNLVDSACKVDQFKLITKMYNDKTPEDLRKLASIIRSENSFLVILGALEGRKLSLVVGCSKEIQKDARKILNFHLEEYLGRGGGDPDLAQGGCILSEEITNDFFKKTINMIRNINPE